jgi:hypothetical protein
MMYSFRSTKVKSLRLYARLPLRLPSCHFVTCSDNLTENDSAYNNILYISMIHEYNINKMLSCFHLASILLFILILNMEELWMFFLR